MDVAALLLVLVALLAFGSLALVLCAREIRGRHTRWCGELQSDESVEQLVDHRDIQHATEVALVVAGERGSAAGRASSEAAIAGSLSRARSRPIPSRMMMR